MSCVMIVYLPLSRPHILTYTPCLSLSLPLHLHLSQSCWSALSVSCNVLPCLFRMPTTCLFCHSTPPRIDGALCFRETLSSAISLFLFLSLSAPPFSTSFSLAEAPYRSAGDQTVFQKKPNRSASYSLQVAGKKEAPVMCGMWMNFLMQIPSKHNIYLFVSSCKYQVGIAYYAVTNIAVMLCCAVFFCVIYLLWCWFRHIMIMSYYQCWHLLLVSCSLCILFFPLCCTLQQRAASVSSDTWWA